MKLIMNDALLRRQGVFVDGRREGEGLLKYVDGARYQGSFKCNQFSGHGQMRYAAILEVSYL
jgi:hypothetical protein